MKRKKTKGTDKAPIDMGKPRKSTYANENSTISKKKKPWRIADK